MKKTRLEVEIYVIALETQAHFMFATPINLFFVFYVLSM
jgi:hypothetical protein